MTKRELLFEMLKTDKEIQNMVDDAVLNGKPLDDNKLDELTLKLDALQFQASKID